MTSSGLQRPPVWLATLGLAILLAAKAPQASRFFPGPSIARAAPMVAPAATREASILIRARGAGCVPASALQAEVELGIEVREAEVERALVRHAQTLAAVRRALSRAGVAEKQMMSGGFELRRELAGSSGSYPAPAGAAPSEPEAVYIARSTLRFATTNSQALPEMLARALDAGASQVIHVAYRPSEDEAARQEALRLAVGAAMTDARLLAESLGVELRAVREIEAEPASPCGSHLAAAAGNESVAGAPPGLLDCIEARVSLLVEADAPAMDRLAAPEMARTPEPRGAASRASRVAERETARAARRATATAARRHTVPSVGRVTATATRRPTKASRPGAEPVATPTAGRCAAGSVPWGDDRPILAFRTVLQGPASRYQDPEAKVVLVTSAAEFAAEVAPLLPHGVTAEVDWSRDCLLAAFAGTRFRPTCRDLVITRVTSNGDALCVSLVAQNAPFSLTPVPAASAYHLVRLDRQDVPLQVQRTRAVETLFQLAIP